MAALIFYPLLFAASVCDIKSREIPNGISVAIALCALFAFQPSKLWGIFVALLLFVVTYFFGGFGGGDLKLIAAAGLVLGFPLCVLGVFIGLAVEIAYYGITVLIQTLRKEQAAKKYLPFVPFLSVGFIAAQLLNIGGIIL